RSKSGDGLGPVFNDTSCIACHNLGGPGGAGPNNKNVEILSVFRESDPGAALAQIALALSGRAAPGARAQGAAAEPDTSELIKLHPGFRTARSLILHKSGADPNYDAWRLKTLGVDTTAMNFDPSALVGGLQGVGRPVTPGDVRSATLSEIAKLQAS